ncbi:MAG: peptidylprolyl isomerase [Myxococcota bacterium]
MNVVMLMGSLSALGADAPTFDEVLAEAPDEAWEAVPPEDLLVMRVGDHDVVIELAPRFAPANVANIHTLVSGGFFDGLAIVRAQDNYVVQWADPDAETAQARSLGAAAAKVPVELDRPSRDVEMTRLASRDAYAKRVGFVDGLPVGSEGGRVWLAHCYGMVGVARDAARDSGNGSSLYVVTGHAPRHLDRNITLVGRVIDQLEVLSALPRGSGRLGFYEGDDALVPITSVRRVSDLPEGERPAWRRIRTDHPTFEALVESRRHRHEAWFLDPVGRIGLCNVPLPRERVR